LTCYLILEARVGFEPTNGGFADLSLGPLGYRAQCPPVYLKASEDVSEACKHKKCWPHGLRCWPHGLRKNEIKVQA
jgi:hypothetical protein